MEKSKNRGAPGKILMQSSTAGSFRTYHTMERVYGIAAKLLILSLVLLAQISIPFQTAVYGGDVAYAVSLEDYLKTFGCDTGITYAFLEEVASCSDVSDLKDLLSDDSYVYLYYTYSEGEYTPNNEIPLRDMASVKMIRTAKSVVDSFSATLFDAWVGQNLTFDTTTTNTVVGLVREGSEFSIKKLSGTNANYKAALESFQDNGTGTLIDNILYDAMGSAQIDLGDTYVGTYIVPKLYLGVSEFVSLMLGLFFAYLIVSLLLDFFYMLAPPFRRFLDGSVNKTSLESAQRVVSGLVTAEARLAVRDGLTNQAGYGLQGPQDMYLNTPRWGFWVIKRGGSIIAFLVIIVLYVTGFHVVVVTAVSKFLYSILEWFITLFM